MLLYCQAVGIEFYDAASQRRMKLIGTGPWNGWIAYKHPDGQWVTLRRATDDDRKQLAQALLESRRHAPRYLPQVQ